MKSTKYKKIITRRAFASAGFTLVELMVGITVGLMVVMVAIYAIITARKASGTVTDISAMKQQASYVMYVMGTQIRQARSMNAVQDDALTASGMPTFYFSQGFTGFSGGTVTNPVALTGVEGGSGASDTLGIALEGSPVLNATQTDCLGNKFPDAGDVLMTFALNTASNELACAVTGGSTQALAQNVTDFQVNYRHRARIAGGDTTTIADASGLGVPGAAGNQWDSVNAVEVCIEMRGTEPVPVVAGATYTDCNNNATAQQGNRLTRVYRSLYNIRVSE